METAHQSRQAEVAEKLRRVRAVLIEHNLDAILLRRVSSFAWITGGAASYVGLAVDIGAATAVVTQDQALITTNAIEAPRLEREEHVTQLGFDLRADPWHTPDQTLSQLIRSRRLGADSAYPGAMDLSARFARLRAALMPQEHARLREVGRLCGEAIGAVARRVLPGQTEVEIAGILSDEVYQRGVTPIVNLIATDERIYSFRHPLPTDKRLDRYAMLVLSGRASGLVASVTRLVHFGPLPDDVRRRQDAVAQVDVELIQATRPGAQLSDILERAAATYARQGYPDEWQRHHQGGATGYLPREYLATPSSSDVVGEGQVFAWNPSVPGAKAEDTILVGADGNEVLTPTPAWPMLDVATLGGSMARPAILEVL